MSLPFILFCGYLLNLGISAGLYLRADNTLSLFGQFSLITLSAWAYYCALYPMELTPEILTYGGGL